MLCASEAQPLLRSQPEMHIYYRDCNEYEIGRLYRDAPLPLIRRATLRRGDS